MAGAEKLSEMQKAVYDVRDEAVFLSGGHIPFLSSAILF